MWALNMLILNIVVPTFHMLIGICNNQIKHKVAIPVTSCLPFNCWYLLWAHHSAFLIISEEKSCQRIVYPIWQVSRWVTLPRALSFSTACWRSLDNYLACLGWVKWVCLCNHHTNFRAKWAGALRRELLLTAQRRQGCILLSHFCLWFALRLGCTLQLCVEISS